MAEAGVRHLALPAVSRSGLHYTTKMRIRACAPTLNSLLFPVTVAAWQGYEAFQERDGAMLATGLAFALGYSLAVRSYDRISAGIRNYLR